MQGASGDTLKLTITALTTNSGYPGGAFVLQATRAGHDSVVMGMVAN